MPNGKPNDHPVTDAVVHGLHPFPPDIEALVLEIHTKNPGVFNDLDWAPFDWEKGTYLDEARTLLIGLLENHGNPQVCRQFLQAYRAATRG